MESGSPEWGPALWICCIMFLCFSAVSFYVDYGNYHFQTKPKSLFKIEGQVKDVSFTFTFTH